MSARKKTTTSSKYKSAFRPPNPRPAYEDPNAPRYLITDYDTPLDPGADEHTDLLLALLRAAKMLRKEAMRWRDDLDWTGNTGEVSEADIEDRFKKADLCDRDAKLLIDEYHRGARREWIATFPREGAQYRKEVYESWKRMEKEDKAREAQGRHRNGSRKVIPIKAKAS